MKGIILAGGTGSRLYPLTRVTNKHLLPVGRQPMIYHAIQKLVEAGILDLLVVTGVEHMGAIVGSLGSGSDFGCELTYRVQDQAGGIAQALGLARHFVGDDKMVVLLGDNLFEDSLLPLVEAFQQQAEGARILIKEVPDPQRFGVPSFKGEQITQIIEKPQQPDSHYAVTGIYCYDAEVFQFIDQLQPSQRGELEITDVNNHYIAKGLLYHQRLQGWWTDAGTFETLTLANQLLAEA